jgi:hypothetical protein
VAARYPVECRLAGEESFCAVAHRLVFAQPPHSAGAARVCRDVPRLSPEPRTDAFDDYLAHVAELEMLRVRAYHAADAVPLERPAFASLRPEQLADLRMMLHQSVEVFASRFPSSPSEKPTGTMPPVS